MHGCKKDAYVKKTKELFIKYYGKYNTNYKGFDYINELTQFENTFEFAINIVKYNKDNSISYIHHTLIRNKNILIYTTTTLAI